MIILYPVLSTPFFFATSKIDLQKEAISLSEALSANEERLYGQMPMEQFASQTSLPSPSPTTALSLLNKYKQAGHIYDTTLLAS